MGGTGRGCGGLQAARAEDGEMEKCHLGGIAAAWAEGQKGGFVPLCSMNEAAFFSHPPTPPPDCSCSPVGDTVKFGVTLRR